MEYINLTTENTENTKKTHFFVFSVLFVVRVHCFCSPSCRPVSNSHYLTAKPKAAKGAKWRKVAQREIVYRENPALLCVSLRPLRLCGKSSGCSELLGLCRRAAEVECLGAFSKNKTQAKRTATAKDALHFLWDYLGWTGSKRPVALGLVGPLHAEFKTYRQIADRMCRRFDSRFPCANL